MEMAIDTPSPAPPTPPTPPAAGGRQTRAAESVRLEHQLVRVPLEALRSTVRSNHRLAEKEIAAALSSAPAAPAESSAAAVDHLTSLVSRLHGLKRKVLPPNPTPAPRPVSRRIESYVAWIRSYGFDSPVIVPGFHWRKIVSW